MFGNEFQCAKTKSSQFGTQHGRRAIKAYMAPNPEIVQHPDRSEMKGMYSRNVERNQVLVHPFFARDLTSLISFSQGPTH